MQNSHEFKKLFKEFWGKICDAHEHFIVWKTLKNPENQQIYDRYHGFWDAVIPGLQIGWILAIAKLFDPIFEDGDKKVLSIPDLKQYVSKEQCQKIDDLLNAHATTIKNLKKWRSKWIAHTDKRYAIVGVGQLVKDFPIKGENIEALLKDMEGVIEYFDPQKGGWSLLKIQSDAECDTRALIKCLQKND